MGKAASERFHLLLVEDNDVDREVVRRAVRTWADVEEARDLTSGLQRLDAGCFGCVLLDLGLPDSDGVETLTAVLEAHPTVPVVVLTGIDDDTFGVELLHHGAQDYLPKSQVSPVLLSRTVRHAVERHRVTSALKASEARYRTLMEHASCGLFLLDEARRVLQVNEEGTRILDGDRDGIIGRSFLDFVPEEHRTHVMPALSEGPAPVREAVCCTVSGQRRDVTLSSTRVSWDGREMSLLVVSDIGAVKILRDQLLQAQKMEAVGRLAGGVAHDFNNLLTVILSFARYVYDDLAPGDARRSDISEILAAGERATALTRQLLVFSRKQPTRPRVVAMNDLLVDLRKMLTRAVGEDVRIHLDLAPDLWSVRVDPRQLEQVILNLSVNSRDAMPGGGDIHISTRNEERSGTGTDMVVLCFSDTGHGIPRDVLPHIFQPFFTTKEARRGTGLGLATCYGIVKQAGGEIEVASQPGESAAFEIRLPRSDLAPTRRRTSETPALMRSRTGGATILLVEDEPLVRKAALRVLERGGYRVLEAKNGNEALAHAMTPGVQIDLLLGDVVMPDMSGMEVASRVLEVHPDMRVLFMTGYAADFLADRGMPESVRRGFQVLQKPFLPDKLLRRVTRVLQSPSSSEEAAARRHS